MVRGGRFLQSAGRFSLRLGLALLPALLLGGYANFPMLAFLPYLALVPWVLLYTDDRRPRVSCGYYVLGSWVAWLLSYSFMFKYGWWAPPIMAAIFFLPSVLFAPVLRRIHERFPLPRTLTVPLVWVAVEWLRATLSLAHFDIYRLGYSQARFPWLVQIADITGVYGVSFLVASVNGLIADVGLALRDAAPPRVAALRSRRIVASAAAVAAGFALFGGYGAFRLATSRNEAGPRLAVVQPNIAHTIRNAVGVHLAQVLLTDRLVPAGAADLVIWPENAILDNIRRDGVYLDDLAWLAREKGAPFLVGTMGKPPGQPGRTTNAAVLVDRNGAILGQYDKLLLYPWSEYTPFDDFLGRVSPRLQRIHRTLNRKGWGFLPPGLAGERMVLFRLPWNGSEIPFATLICIENIYPPIPAEARRLGARFFVNITSEGEAGAHTQEQMLRIAMMRAVENRISYVRAGNTGVSGFIDPQGRLIRVLRGERGRAIGDTGVLIDRVPLSAEPGLTVYAASRDAFALACLAATAALLLLSFTRRGRMAAAVSAVLLAVLGAPGCGSPLPPPGEAAAARAAIEKGRGLLVDGRPRLALEELRAACAEESACGEALELAAEAFRRMDQAEQASDFFAAVAERYPGLEGRARTEGGFFIEKAEGPVAAEREFAEAAKLAPGARVFASLGNVRLRLEDAPGAVEAYREAIRLDPVDPQLRYLLARALRVAGNGEEARGVLEELLAKAPQLGSAWAVLGRVRAAAGDEAGAAEAFRMAARVDPQNVEGRFWLARLALRAGDRERARRMLAEIRRIEAGLGRGLRED